MAKDKFGNIKCANIATCSARAINHCCTIKSTKTIDMKQCKQFIKSE